MSENEVLRKIKKGLIVSCQALEDEPLHGPDIMGKMALAAESGGAVAIRANSVEDIKEIKKNVSLPIIGLIKADYPNKLRYITPTIKEVKALVEVGVDIIALDATYRDGMTEDNYREIVTYIKNNNILAMADISTLEEGIKAEQIGFDIISSTLSGYTSYSPQSNGPDYKLVKQLVNSVKIPVIAEGKIASEKQLTKMLKSKPYAVVMGGGITRPQLITKRFVNIYQGKLKV